MRYAFTGKQIIVIYNIQTWQNSRIALSILYLSNFIVSIINIQCRTFTVSFWEGGGLYQKTAVELRCCPFGPYPYPNLFSVLIVLDSERNEKSVGFTALCVIFIIIIFFLFLDNFFTRHILLRFSIVAPFLIAFRIRLVHQRCHFFFLPFPLQFS